MSSICNILRSSVQEAGQNLVLMTNVIRTDLVPFIFESGERFLVGGVLATPAVIAPLVFGWEGREGKGTDLADVIIDIVSIWSIALGMYAVAKVRELSLRAGRQGLNTQAQFCLLLSVGG